MKVSELSERSGVSLPTIKFYIREGLLRPGQATGRNQAEYSEQHLERLSLIRALRDDAGLSIASIARALAAADAVKEEFVQAAIDAIERPSGPPVSERSKEFSVAKGEVLALARKRGWQVHGDERSLGDAARALAVIRRAFPEEGAEEIAPYGAAAELLSEYEIPEGWTPFDAPDAALRYAMLGTVLFEPLLLALRRLAHVSRTRGMQVKAERAAATEGAPEAAGDAKTRDIYGVVRAVPRGKVATYGQIAELAGMGAGHRLVARAMRSCPKGLPWQRVVAKKDARRARVAIEDPEHAAQQRRLLEAEGVRFDANGCIALRDYGWLPTDAPAGRRRD